MSTFPILFQNSEILIINKPAGVSVQGGQGILHPLDKELSLQLGYQIYLVHRLDRDTAGLLIVAKSSASAAKWTKIIAGKGVKKTYTAFCMGRPVLSGKECSSGSIKSIVQSHGRSQQAELFFNVEDECSIDENLKLFRISVTLGTGRMHQIRIQMAQSGAPLAGDDKHGDFKVNKLLRKIGIKKLCLAATVLTIPLEGGNKTFTVALPDHMKSIAEKFFQPANS